ncbi:hypothetical protein C8R43DRAFT_1108180 [Mycena crocata]|nr:hypothetical protein C8R43DRAFT_1108180 [Mycena crocata]
MLCDSCRIPIFFPDAFPDSTQTAALQDFLRSTRIPSDPSYYHSQIVSSTAILAQYDSEIERIDQTLQDLRMKRSRVQIYADGCRAALAPIRRLPAEILCEIFVSFSLSANTLGSLTEELDNLAKSNLMQLSKVCSNWHNLITGTSSLWSHIAVNLSYWPSGGPHLDLLKRSLGRAGGHLLTITFCSTSGYSSTMRESVFALLAEHSQRWQSLALYIKDWSHVPNLSLVEGRLDNLEALSFMFLSRNTPSAEQVAVFETAPRLTRVSIIAQHLRCCPLLPWSQLGTFTYNAMRTDDIVPFFTLMRNAQPGTVFEVRNFSADRLSPLPPITSAVATFDLMTSRNSMDGGPSLRQAIGDVLDSLTLPHLQNLNLKPDFPTTLPLLWPATQFAGLSHRSSFGDTLRSLNICYVTITEDDLILSLTSLSSLQCLTISDERWGVVLLTDALLRRLTLTSDPGSSLATQLKFLDCTSVFKFSTQAYLDFAMARTAHAPSFRGILRDFFGRSCRFEAAKHESLVDFVAEHQIEQGERENK